MQGSTNANDYELINNNAVDAECAKALGRFCGRDGGLLEALGAALHELDVVRRMKSEEGEEADFFGVVFDIFLLRPDSLDFSVPDDFRVASSCSKARSIWLPAGAQCPGGNELEGKSWGMGAFSTVPASFHRSLLPLCRRISRTDCRALAGTRTRLWPPAFGST